MKRYKLAIFDLDGTILNTIKDLTNTMNHALDLYNLPNVNEKQVATYLGNGIRRLCELAVPINTDIKVIDGVFNAFNEYYTIHCNDYTSPYDGIIDVINKIKENGIKVAVVSNKADYAVKPLLNHHFKDIFEYGVGLKDGIRKKPYPDSCNEILNKLNIDRKEAVYIGDTEVDIETAKNAGMDCISVSWGFRSKEELINAGACKIIDGPDLLVKYLEK